MNGPRMWCLATAVLLAAGLVPPAWAEAVTQDVGDVASAEALADAVRSNDGIVRFEFSARPGVWGNGRTWNLSRDRDGGGWAGRPPSAGCDGCTNGPIRVTIRVEDGAEARVWSQVGGEWSKTGRDVGMAPAAVAADYLLALVEHAGRELDADSKEAALQAAVSASAEAAWPRLLDVARDRAQNDEVRKAALFWTAHEAGARVAAHIEEIAVSPEEASDVQEAAVFALSQLPGEGGTEALLRLARENRNPEIVQAVYFWLGQREDPRVIELFEDVLLEGSVR